MTQALREAIAARRELAGEEMVALEREMRLCDRLLAVIDGSEVSGAGGHRVLDAPTLAKPKRKWTRRAFGVAGKRGAK